MTEIERMRIARELACLTVSDMALWFGVSRAAMNSWVVGNYTPLEGTRKQLVPLLCLLEKVIKRTKYFPVPLAIRQYDRKAYIEKVREHATIKFSSGSTAKGRKTLCRSNRQD